MVESPGKLLELVRTDNIRHTHFSRNPRIAEFLKAYDFVKKHGEGVDRMCSELECTGMRMPDYYSNVFILQMIIRNTKVEKGMEKAVVTFVKSAIDAKKSVFGVEKPVFDTRKLEIESLKSAIDKKLYKEPTKKNIIQVYESIDTNQIFGASDVAKILDCAPSTAGEIMSKLREMNVIRAVKGKGKGKYRFANVDEEA